MKYPFFNKILLDIEHAGRSDLRVVARSYRHACMSWSTSNRIVQNAADCVVSPPLLGKARVLLTMLKACHWSVRVSLMETARGGNLFWPCHPLPPFTGVTVIPSIPSLTRYCQRYSWERLFVWFSLESAGSSFYYFSSGICLPHGD